MVNLRGIAGLWTPLQNFLTMLDPCDVCNILIWPVHKFECHLRLVVAARPLLLVNWLKQHCDLVPTGAEHTLYKLNRNWETFSSFKLNRLYRDYIFVVRPLSQYSSQILHYYLGTLRRSIKYFVLFHLILCSRSIFWQSAALRMSPPESALWQLFWRLLGISIFRGNGV